MTKPRIPRDLLDPIVAYFKPQRVILFGSRARGEATFPVPTLTEKNKLDLTRCAEDILLAREAHFHATIAELYDPDKMPADLRDAHERNDEVLEPSISAVGSGTTPNARSRQRGTAIGSA